MLCRETAARASLSMQQSPRQIPPSRCPCPGARRRQDEIQLPSVGQPVFNALEEQELVLVSPPTARLNETPRAVRGLVDELHRLFSLQVRAASDKSEVRLLGLFLRR